MIHHFFISFEAPFGFMKRILSYSFIREFLVASIPTSEKNGTEKKFLPRRQLFRDVNSPFSGALFKKEDREKVRLHSAVTSAVKN